MLVGVLAPIRRLRDANAKKEGQRPANAQAKGQRCESQRSKG